MATRYITTTITITGKGEILDTIISLPKNAKYVKGVCVINNVVSVGFPPAPAYVPTAPTIGAVSALALESTQQAVLDALVTMSGGNTSDFEKIKAQRDYKKVFTYLPSPNEELVNTIVHSSVLSGVSPITLTFVYNLPTDDRVIEIQSS
jgi:hypothetical protein